jgi:ABC-type multidrug transport system ATPase subunit
MTISDEEMMKLELKKVKKQYDSLIALNSVDLCFDRGIIGVLGPNGAGKSTMIKIICQIIEQNQGEVWFMGERIKKDFKSKFGLMPQQQDLYPHFTVKEFMFYMCALKGITSKEAKKEVNEKLSKVGLIEKRYAKISELSGGMKQRLLIAQTLLGNPPILIFDEPTAGLDPKQRIEIRNMFSELAANHIVIITTHVVQDVESIASKIIMIKEGEIIQQGSPIDIVESIEGKVKEVFIQKEELSEYQKKYKLSNISQKSSGYVLRIITDNSFDHESIVYPNLEDAYLWYVGDSV